MNITPEQLEELGRLVDQASNLAAASQLPVRPEIHIQGMRGGLVSIGESLRKLYAEGSRPKRDHSFLAEVRGLSKWSNRATRRSVGRFCG